MRPDTTQNTIELSCFKEDLKKPLSWVHSPSKKFVCVHILMDGIRSARVISISVCSVSGHFCFRLCVHCTAEIRDLKHARTESQDNAD